MQSIDHYLTETLKSSEFDLVTNLDELVTRYRETGDLEIRNKIINGHMRLAVYLGVKFISGYRLSKKHHDPVISYAVTSLCDVVILAKAALYDNNITAYITNSVRRNLGRYFKQLQMIKIDHRAYKKLDVKFTVEKLDEENPFYKDEDDHAPATYDDYTFITEEMIGTICKTPKERVILEMRMRGHTYQEIGKRFGVSRQSIFDNMKKIKERV